MGVVCVDDKEKRNKTEIRKINRGELDITNITDEEIKKENNKLKKNQEELIKKINEKFNYLNNNEKNVHKKFSYKKIKFSFQNCELLEIDIDDKTAMNEIYQKIKNKKQDLPDKNKISFFYNNSNICKLFDCSLPISKFNIDLNNPISLIYNDVEMPDFI